MDSSTVAKVGASGQRGSGTSPSLARQGQFPQEPDKEPEPLSSPGAAACLTLGDPEEPEDELTARMRAYLSLGRSMWTLRRVQEDQELLDVVNGE